MASCRPIKLTPATAQPMIRGTTTAPVGVMTPLATSGAMKTGKIARWLVAEGASLEAGQPLLEVETDKITNVVESPAGGVLFQIIAPAGEVVPVKQVIGIIADAGETPERVAGGEAPAAAAASTSAAPAAAAPAKDKKSGSVRAMEFVPIEMPINNNQQDTVTAAGIAETLGADVMWDGIDKGFQKVTGSKPKEAFNQFCAGIALGRPEYPEDVANFVSYLAGPDSDYMTGQAVLIDGGMVYR